MDDFDLKKNGPRIGFFGGTFDPIHFGHLNAALEIMEYHGLDQVWFCPAKINPHKMGVRSASAHHRLKMLEIALEDLPHFGIVPNELQREGASFTIDTIRELIFADQKRGEAHQFFLILGEDSLATFFNWKEVEELIKLAPPLVARRSLLENALELKGDPKINEALRMGLTPTHFLEISATWVRARVAKRQYIGHLVPSKVVDYIYQNQLYFMD